MTGDGSGMASHESHVIELVRGGRKGGHSGSAVERLNC